MKTWTCIILWLALSGVAQAAEPTWRWIWVVPASDPNQGWTTFQGEAPVRFDGRRIEATLWARSDQVETELQVEGRVTGRKAQALVTRVGTDASPERYDGGYEKSRSKLTDAAAGWGDDRISLRSGSSFLGLYRQVAPPR